MPLPDGVLEPLRGNVKNIRVQLLRGNLNNIRVPGSNDNVFKDEDIFSFDSPFCKDGLYVCLKTWQGFSRHSLMLGLERGAGPCFLHEVWKRVPNKEQTTTGGEVEGILEPAKLAIGVEGGFKTEDQQFQVVKEHWVVVLDGDANERLRFRYPDTDLPLLVCQAVDAIIDHKGAAESTEVAAWEATDECPVSKYADNLEQLPAETKISSDPSSWKCEEGDTKENLWLNLSTGYIGSGRRNWDGSGGTGAALRHYEATGERFPLVVKLGMITPHGADVYSYAKDEDCMVKDPKLAEHLRHWGIDMIMMEKTDRSMAELEVELNKCYDFSKITEAGLDLEAIQGPGYTGMKNMGNSCYINSCLQLLSALPEVQERYGEVASEAAYRTDLPKVSSDFACQMCKVVTGLNSGRYSPPSAPPYNFYCDEVIPRLFKHLVGRNHQEFSTTRQQDAAEYIVHLLHLMELSDKERGQDLSFGKLVPSLFKFRLKTRIECGQSHKVRYKMDEAEPILHLQIPTEAAINMKEVQASRALIEKQKCKGDVSGTVDEVHPKVNLSACLEKFSAPSVVLDWLSPVTGQRGTAINTVKFGNFPKYLLLKLGRYYVDESWQSKKLDVEVNVPIELDIKGLRCTGLQPGETEMPCGDNGQASEFIPMEEEKVLVPDESIVEQLVSMGFGVNGCRRAALAVSNAGVDQAMNWVFEHMEDSNFNDSLKEDDFNCTSGTRGGTADDAEALVTLMSFGFEKDVATASLDRMGGDAHRAADFLLTHGSEGLQMTTSPIDRFTNESRNGGSGGDSSLTDGPGKYTLIGFISHVGKNTSCGHYVAHVMKEGLWIIFNDNAVAISKEPPLCHGYIYLYGRNDEKQRVHLSAAAVHSMNELVFNARRILNNDHNQD